ncbi:thermonuclease family protein [Chromatiaceae bacterium AAb-1]|nr:thermonuclease family protein [Chromatiaceae bacterium AAb-1]
MQINSSTDKTLTTPSVTQSERSASAAVNTTETAASANQRGKASSRQAKQVAVLARWGVTADISKQLTRQDQAERSVKQVYSGLEQLKRQLISSGSAMTPAIQQQSQKQLQQLEQLVQQKSSELTPQLEPRRNSPEAISRYLARVDLLSERRQPEHIQILLGRTGNAVSLNLPAGQNAPENLHTVKQAFAQQQIKVDVDQQQRLYFSADQRNARKLQEPWLMSGEGVRVAAGNPVSVKLQQPESALQALSKNAERAASVQAYRAEIQQVQQRLKESLVQIQAQRQALVAQLQQAQGVVVADDTAELEYISQQLRIGMSSGSSTAVSAVMAQANVTRNLVEFGLAQY